MVDVSTAPRTVRLAADGVQLTDDLYGDEAAPPVLLLHGAGQTRHAWGNAAITLAGKGRFAIAVDLRGHGDSDWSPDGNYGIDPFARDVAALAKALDRRPTLVGASPGGRASLIAVGEGGSSL